MIGVARGDEFPDALTGGTHAAILGGPVLLTPTDALDAGLAAYACTNRGSIETGFVYGGPQAISPATLAAIADRLNGVGC